MIKYNIIHKNSIDKALVKFCITILEMHGIEKLPHLNIGEEKNIFSDRRTNISLVCIGSRCGYFTMREQTGDCIGYFKSAIFEY